MSTFIHTEREFNILAKYFKETLKMDNDFTDNLIFNLYQFEVKATNTRYDENNRLDIVLYEDEEYNALELITSYDALKLLDSIKCQASAMQSDILWEHVLNVHNKLVNGIIKIEQLKSNYKDTEEYMVSAWW